MAQTFTLDAQSRTVIGKQVKALRRQDLIPAVIYGAGDDPVHISCPRRALEIVLQKAGGTHIVALSVDKDTHNVIIREVQRNKITRIPLHVDFMRVDLTKKLRTEVPISLKGEPKLATDLLLTHGISQMEVECLPNDIPEHIEVNIANLTTLGAQITVGDLPAIPGVHFLTDPHDIIARIDSQGTAEVEEAAAETAAAAEPEVIEKGKKEEEEF